MRFHSFVYSLLTLLSFIACNPTATKHQQSFDTKKIAEFKHFISKEITAGKIAGAEVLISKDNKIVLHEAQGFANITKQKELAKNSIYYIQSMTKPLISVAIMQLVEKEIIALEDAVHMYIPEVKDLRITTDVELGIDAPTRAPKKTITIRNLLTHTAGMTHGLGSSKLDQELFKLLYKETLDYKGHPDLESRVDVLMHAPLIGEPGEQWAYSAAPDLLALILQRISKKSIPDYLKEHIFDPLRMIDPGYNLSEEQSKRVMQLHSLKETGGIELSPLQVPTQGNAV